MFIASDPHQRIYESNVSLARLGISVSGRSHRLALSYRTTARILAAVPLLGMNPVTRPSTRGDTPAATTQRSRQSSRLRAQHA